jgi:hypothetical protein
MVFAFQSFTDQLQHLPKLRCIYRYVSALNSCGAVSLHAMEALGERRYSSYSFTKSALDGGEWSASRPGRALPSRKGPPVPIGEEAGWAPEPVWTQRIEEKSFAPSGDRNPIARRPARSQTLYCLS